MNCRGTEPPTTLSTNSKPAPAGSGSTSMSQTAYWPWPPDCLTCRPWPVGRAGERLAQRHPHGRPGRPSTPYRLRSRSSSTSTCASPMHHSTSWWVSGLCSSRSVGSSATSRARPWRELVLVGLGLRRDRDRQQRLGHRPRLASAAARPCRTACRRSRRGDSFATAQMSPATQCGDRALGLAERRGQRADLLVDVVVRVARASSPTSATGGRRRARRCRAAACRRRPGPG